jgi:nucleoside-diphosphate-sugar epimerase
MSEIAREKSVPEKPRVLVTGASGFLGKYAVGEFLDSGYHVTATGRNPHALSEVDAPNVDVVATDLEHLASLELSVDTVVHAAALSSPWGKWSDFYENNVVGTQHMVDFAEKNNVRRFVYVSSPSIYTGSYDKLDIIESDYDPANKLNYYIQSKLLAEQLLQDAHTQGRLPELVIVRPRGLLGVGDPSMIPRLLLANEKIGIPLFNDGKNMVDLTCVENVALALRLAAESAYAQGDVYNITNGEPREFKSILDEFFVAIKEVPRYKQMNLKVVYGLASVLERLYALSLRGNEPPLTRYAVSTLGHSQTLNISKAIDELGYRPTVTLSEGIAKYAEHYRSSRA